MPEQTKILISENPVHLVYHIKETMGGPEFIQKQLHAAFPGDDLIAQLKNEYLTAVNLDIEGLRKPIEFSEKEGNYLLRLQYIHGQTLSEYVQSENPSPTTLLNIFVDLCKTIGQIHQENWIHASISTTNILIEEFSGKPILIDGSLMMRYSQKASSQINPYKFKSILPYVSPEQTARTNKAMDHRSDLYSLGVTMYEAFTKAKPFRSDDTLELVYFHLAKQARVPKELNPDIPLVLSDIIVKLLSKNAEDRYQSAYGLKHDLERLQDNLDIQFDLGEKDFTGKLLLPQKLYGREEAVQTLLKNQADAHNGEWKAIFVTGHSGTGKTAIVREVLKPITQKKGYYLSGKFDQYVGNIPYSAWIEIFEDFINQLLSADESEIKQWRERLIESLGNSIGVLADLIPNLKYIIHDIAPIKELGVSETKNRLNDILIKFFKAIAGKDHPITVFIDDIQWADNASLNLLKTLLQDADCQYLLLIGAYRSEELHTTHPLFMKMEELQKSGTSLTEIKLGNLTKDQLNLLVSETLSTDAKDALALTNAIFKKTQGNPYYSNKFIQAIYEEELIQFSWPDSIRDKKPSWNWSLEGINAKFVSGNLVELLVSQILESPKAVVSLLSSAACIGNSFRLKQVAVVGSEPIEVLSEYLDQAVNAGYIFYKNTSQIHRVREGMDVDYQFSHDRVQQAFYSLIPEEEKQKTHFEIGKLLFNSLERNQVSDQIFQVLFHLNQGVDFAHNEEDSLWLAKLNLQAGREAKKIIAFDSAYDYIAKAQKLVGEEIWKTDEDLAIEIAKEFLECSFITHRNEEAEEYFNFLVDKVPDKTKKAELYYRKMIQYLHLSKIDDILDTGLAGLDLLGFKLSPKAGKGQLLVELIKTYWMLRGKDISFFENLPEMTDPKSKIAMSLLYKSQVFAYDRSEELMAIIGMKLVQLTLKEGNHPASSSGFHTYAGILSVGFNNFKTAKMMNQVAINSALQANDTAYMAMSRFGMGMNTYTSFDEALEQFKISFDLAVEAGVHTDAAPSTMYFFFLSFLGGKRLNEVRQIILDNLYFTKRIKTDNFHLILLSALSVVDELKSGDRSEELKTENDVEKEELEAMIRATEHKSIRVYSRIFQMHNHILFGRYDEALECEKEVNQVLNVTLGSVLGPYFHFLSGVLHAQLWSSSDSKNQSKGKVNKSVKTIRKFLKTNPSNYEIWDLILRAEQNKIRGRYKLSQTLYDQAISKARKMNRTHEVALACNLCGRFNQSTGNLNISNFYFGEAVKAYTAWGADEVASFLSHQLNSSSVIDGNRIKAVDEDSLFKLSQLISGEIDFEKLLRNLMRIFIENAGAEKAILVMKSEDKWYVEAEQIKNEEVQIEREELFAKDTVTKTGISSAICQYVIRTSETIVIDDGKADARFARTPYIQEHQPRSILCMPLVKKGKLMGLVYLENNMLVGAFKADRIQLLTYISSQIAISIENARLYTEMRSLNKGYERFVPKEFLQLLGKTSIIDVNLGDQIQMNMSVLFADIRDFTGRSEHMTPTENFAFINSFLSRMEPIIRKYHGFVDKYIGDEIMALFPTNADDAVRCGIAMLHELRIYGDQLRNEGQEPVMIGIGVNTGSLMLGTVGGQERMNSTVISDTVNIASRVEKDTKISGAPFIITSETFKELKDPSAYSMRNLGKRTYRGKSVSINAFEVFESEGQKQVQLKNETKKDFELGIELFEKEEYSASLEVLKRVLKTNRDDHPARLIVAHLDELVKGESGKTDVQIPTRNNPSTLVSKGKVKN